VNLLVRYPVPSIRHFLFPGAFREQQGDPGGVRLHVVIGVTGHRNPSAEELPRMRAEFETVLETVALRTPDSPVTLLSPLAAGCDQFAAEWALAWGETRPLPKTSQSRVRLMVPRPLPREDYLTDFIEPHSRDRYLELESKAWLAFDLPLGTPEPERVLDRDPTTGCVVDIEGRQDRSEHYRRLGRFVAQHSHIMVAFWDGVPPNLLGGTAEIVQFCRTGGTWIERSGGAFRSAPFRERAPLLSEGDPTPTWVVSTPRAGSQSKALQSTTPIPDLQLDFLDDLQRLNRSLRATPKTPGSSRSECRSATFANAPGIQETCELWERLDQVASNQKANFVNRTRVFILLLVIAVGAFEVFSSFDEHRILRYGVVVYVGLLIAAWLWRGFIHRGRAEWLFVCTRSITEVLRIQCAMAMAGIREEVTEWGLAHSESDTRDLRRFTRGVFVPLLAAPSFCHDTAGEGVLGAPRSTSQQLTQIRDIWLKGQADYWEGASAPCGRRANTVRRIRRWEPRINAAILLAAVGMAVWVFLCGQSESQVSKVGCLVVGLSLAIRVGLGMWEDASMDREDLAQFSRMRSVFARALERWPPDLSTVEACTTARSVLRAAGREQFAEACEWYMRHRERLPDVNLG